MTTLSLDESFAVAADGERIERTAAALRANDFTTHVVDAPEDARRLVSELVPRDRGVFTAQSETLRTAGITADLDESGAFTSIRAGAPAPSGDIYDVIRLGALPDVVVGSVHAITEQGHLVVGSASGSQFAPYASGARQAIWVAGAQKIVPDLDTALGRLRTFSLPRENERLRERYGQTSFIARILILEREAFPDRGTVIIVREPIGF
ncbi:lactate utilization protein [Actinoplanes hulinensis]|uniref:Lactate utilization protein n=1 Tax=Actinoplanes hulinensis TaxID=1144547 RepID=A0ABS7B2I7_9ACTN|nr:LUD domain-containing protein [Actinoplanes hulinensis]MBW6435185.1 lactate utilization protein [Actinoplanes hulinensis]